MVGRELIRPYALDSICANCYIPARRGRVAVEVIVTDQFEDWYRSLDEKDADEALA